jgi:hypothetical protein
VVVFEEGGLNPTRGPEPTRDRRAGEEWGLPLAAEEPGEERVEPVRLVFIRLDDLAVLRVAPFRALLPISVEFDLDPLPQLWPETTLQTPLQPFVVPILRNRSGVGTAISPANGGDQLPVWGRPVGDRT